MTCIIFLSDNPILWKHGGGGSLESCISKKSLSYKTINHFIPKDFFRVGQVTAYTYLNILKKQQPQLIDRTQSVKENVFSYISIYLVYWVSTIYWIYWINSIYWIYWTNSIYSMYFMYFFMSIYFIFYEMRYGTKTAECQQ